MVNSARMGNNRNCVIRKEDTTCTVDLSFLPYYS